MKQRQKQTGAPQVPDKKISPGIWIGIAVAAAVVLAAVAAVLWGRSGSNARQAETTQTESAQQQDTSQADSFSDDAETVPEQTESPETTEDRATEAEGAVEATPAPEEAAEIENTQGLVLSALFTSSLENPDGSGTYVEDLLSLEVTNSSEAFLERAELTAVRSDGTEAHFVVEGLPAGMTADVFETSDLTAEEGVYTLSLTCTAESWLEAAPLMEEALTLTYGADGLSVAVANTGGETLTGLTLAYHCDLGGVLLGGTLQTLTIERLAPGEEITLTDQSLLGNLLVVRID